MKITKIPGFGSYGQYIDDVDFTTLSNEEWMELGRSHLKNLLTIFRNHKGLTKDEYVERIAKFGPTKGSVRATIAKKYGRLIDVFDPESLKGVSEEDIKFLTSRKYMLEPTEKGNMLSRIYGVKDEEGHMLGSFDSGDLGWHSNESSQLTFAPEVCLMGSKNMLNSATGFMQTANYYESVSNSFRSELDEMIVLHTYKEGAISAAESSNSEFRKQIQLNFCPVEDSETPMVLTSPGGIRGLHYTINSAHRIKGLSIEESNKIFKQIDSELFGDKYTFYHHYQSNDDLVLFDNSITLHCRLKGDVDRLAYRIQYDPCHLLDAPWYPYDQKEFLDAYIDGTHELVKILEIKDFKLPVKY